MKFSDLLSCKITVEYESIWPTNNELVGVMKSVGGDICLAWWTGGGAPGAEQMLNQSSSCLLVQRLQLCPPTPYPLAPATFCRINWLAFYWHCFPPSLVDKSSTFICKFIWIAKCNVHLSQLLSFSVPLSLSLWACDGFYSLWLIWCGVKINLYVQ